MSRIDDRRAWSRKQQVLVLLAVLVLVTAAWSSDLGLPNWQSVCALSFSPDGKTLAVGFYDGKHFNENFKNFEGDLGRAVVLFDVDSGVSLNVLERRRLEGFTLAPPFGQFLDFSPDGATLAVGNWDGPVRLFDVKTQQSLSALQPDSERVTVLAFSKDGHWLAAGYRIWTTLWNTARLTESKRLETRNRLGSIAFSPDSTLLAGGYEWHDGVEIWSVDDGRSKERIPIGPPSSENVPFIQSIAFSPDGNLLALGGYEGALVWNLRSRRKQFVVDGCAISVAFSPDGTTLAMGGERSLRYWNIESAKEIGAFSSPSLIRSLVYSPNGTLIATGDDAGDITLRESITGTTRWTAHISGPWKPKVISIIGLFAGLVLMGLAWLPSRKNGGRPVNELTTVARRPPALPDA